LAPETQVIMITAHGNPDLAAEAASLGAYAMVTKPFELESLAAMVDRAKAAATRHER
jgi:DNA-binding NtrC family response regulator